MGAQVDLLSTPDRLARDIHDMAFRTAERIAENPGIERTATLRVRPGISRASTQATSDGHCGLATRELTALAEKLLEVPRTLINAGRSRGQRGQRG